MNSCEAPPQGGTEQLRQMGMYDGMSGLMREQLNPSNSLLKLRTGET